MKRADRVKRERERWSRVKGRESERVSQGEESEEREEGEERRESGPNLRFISLPRGLSPRWLVSW
jgi:hypothetical protein